MPIYGKENWGMQNSQICMLEPALTPHKKFLTLKINNQWWQLLGDNGSPGYQTIIIYLQLIYHKKQNNRERDWTPQNSQGAVMAAWNYIFQNKNAHETLHIRRWLNTFKLVQNGLSSFITSRTVRNETSQPGSKASSCRAEIQLRKRTKDISMF